MSWELLPWAELAIFIVLLYSMHRLYKMLLTKPFF